MFVLTINKFCKNVDDFEPIATAQSNIKNQRDISVKRHKTKLPIKVAPWSSGYGRRLTTWGSYFFCYHMLDGC